MQTLDPSAIASLGNLPIKARYIVQGALSGLHRAQLHGSSVEFTEHKEYSPGDEMRHIDWKAFGKFDRYYVKRFEQESQLTANLVLDCSASMGFAGGEVSKLAYAVHLMAALGYLLIGQRDRVGLWAFGDPKVHAHERVSPRSAPNHASELYRVLERVLERGASGQESAASALEQLAERRQRQRSLVILVSDLFGQYEEALEVLRLLRARGHDPVLFQVLDPHELSLPYSGLTRFSGLEDKRELMVDPDHMRKQYQARLRRFLDRVQEACTDSGIEYHLVATDTAIESTLLDFTVARSKLGRARAV